MQQWDFSDILTYIVLLCLSMLCCLLSLSDKWKNWNQTKPKCPWNPPKRSHKIKVSKTKLKGTGMILSLCWHLFWFLFLNDIICEHSLKTGFGQSLKETDVTSKNKHSTKPCCFVRCGKKLSFTFCNWYGRIFWEVYLCGYLCCLLNLW